MSINHLQTDRWSLGELQKITEQGYADVECTCGEVHRLEPHSAISCPHCGEWVETPHQALGMV